LNEDFQDFLIALGETGARFLVVGAHAMAVHGVPRATGDLGIWIERDPENAARVWRALVAFGAPAEGLGISQRDLEQPDVVIQVAAEVPFLGRAMLLKNKRATGRLRDLADLESLGEPPGA
jgi:hypothetical protein